MTDKLTRRDFVKAGAVAAAATIAGPRSRARTTARSMQSL